MVANLVNNDMLLIIANSDQYADTDINAYLAAMGEHDGLIMTMPSSHPKWSYIRYSEQGFVIFVWEKEVISDR